ncbi:oxaloacetate decarboxylase [Terrihabitans soli]|uniref:Oxaloacetate decarboxylase n=1 Tax=Terrihabitans soli TaxID=708113 RepID=A0A6S6QTZ5_9HYPH|nr:isocitrate lyase/PEP mutase family protein [Terrihabitans soli]BCJ90541.1 oxaloacetate decarboxylase [Terrihabitans soli]
MIWSDRRRRFRAVLDGTGCVMPASVFDPVSARIAEQLGYEFAILGGSVASHAILGAPDLLLVTASELAEQCRRINRAAEIPLLVDADHGFGNALNAARTAQELEMAGVSAITIEDTALPVPYGGYRGSRLISLDEAVGKLNAVIGARHDPDFSVIARTTYFGGDRTDMIDRLRAYEACGVDALFISGLSTRDDLDTVAASVRLPFILGRLPPDLADTSYLTTRRVRAGLNGHRTFLVAAQAIYEALAAERDPHSHAARPAMDKTLFDILMRGDEHRQLSRKALGLSRETAE